MKINKIFLALTALTVFAFSCATEERGPIVDLTSVETGAYPRLVSETDKLFNLFDISGSNYTYQVEFVDIEEGALMAEYVVDLIFDDNDPSNGDQSTSVSDYITLTPDQLSPGEFNYLRGPEITVNGSEMLAALGLSEDDVSPGDEFDFVGRLVLTDGRIFTETNSSATVTGNVFRGHFNFTMPAGCPSDLAGTFAYTTTNIWCGGADVSGEVDLVSLGGGAYEFSDWAFGAYGPCYGGGTAGGDLNFQDVCSEVTFTGFTDSFGDTWTYDSSIDGEEWTIAWENTYGESATSVITFPGGVPFTLAE
ncbi:MAG TPA: hypothetical protein VJ953_15575 [Saprospiraceae bacterium]|nr:hypothetical protein [Saprospiraceae bacterium]